MSSNDDDKPRFRTFQVSRSTWSEFYSAFNTAVKPTEHGLRLYRSLLEPIVLAPAYHAMNAAAQGRHFQDDAVIMLHIKRLLHVDDQFRCDDFQNDIRETQPPPAVPDPTIPPWWCSRGRALLEHLRTEFGGAGADDAATLRAALYRISLSDFGGDVHRFERAVRKSFASYRNAVAAANEPTAHLDRDLATHAIEHFYKQNPDRYSVVATMLRQDQHKTLNSVLRAFRTQYDHVAPAYEEKKSSKVLTTLQPVTDVPDLMVLLQQAIRGLQPASRGTKGAHAKAPRTPRAFSSPEEEALYKSCIKNKYCFNNLTKGCKFGDKCKWAHKTVPATSATVSTTDHPFTVLLCTFPQDPDHLPDDGTAVDINGVVPSRVSPPARAARRSVSPSSTAPSSPRLPRSRSPAWPRPPRVRAGASLVRHLASTSPSRPPLPPVSTASLRSDDAKHDAPSAYDSGDDAYDSDGDVSGGSSAPASADAGETVPAPAAGASPSGATVTPANAAVTNGALAATPPAGVPAATSAPAPAAPATMATAFELVSQHDAVTNLMINELESRAAALECSYDPAAHVTAIDARRAVAHLQIDQRRTHAAYNTLVAVHGSSFIAELLDAYTPPTRRAPAERKQREEGVSGLSSGDTGACAPTSSSRPIACGACVDPSLPPRESAALAPRPGVFAARATPAPFAAKTAVSLTPPRVPQFARKSGVPVSRSPAQSPAQVRSGDAEKRRVQPAWTTVGPSKRRRRDARVEVKDLPLDHLCASQRLLDTPDYRPRVQRLRDQPAGRADWVGVFNTEHLPRAGMRIGIYDGHILSHADVAMLYPDRARADYLLEVSADGQSFYVDAVDPAFSGWARDVNQAGPSQRPNVRFETDDGVVFVATLRAIAPGEQLLVDYGDAYEWPPGVLVDVPDVFDSRLAPGGVASTAPSRTSPPSPAPPGGGARAECQPRDEAPVSPAATTSASQCQAAPARVVCFRDKVVNLFMSFVNCGEIAPGVARGLCLRARAFELTLGARRLRGPRPRASPHHRRLMRGSLAAIRGGPPLSRCAVPSGVGRRDHLVLATSARPDYGYDRAPGGDIMFVVDTGANGVVFSAEVLRHVANFKPVAGHRIHSNSHADVVLGTGSLSASLLAADGARVTVNIPHGLVCPKSRWNIIPPHMLPGFLRASIARDSTITFELDGGRSVATRPFSGLQVLSLAPAPRVSLATAAPAMVVGPPATPTMQQLHLRLAHAAPSTIHRLIHAGVIKIPDPATRTAVLACRDVGCLHCATASNPAKSATSVARHDPPSPDPDGVWSSDLSGPLVRSVGGCSYILLYCSHKSGMVFFFPIKGKDHQAEVFMAHQARMELEANDPIAILRTDNGGEYRNTTMDAYCKLQGIVRQFTAPHSSFQNGRVERAIRTLRSHGGANLSRSGLPPSFWAEAISHATYVFNRLPRADGRPSPLEAAHGVPPSLHMVHPFGSLAMASVRHPVKSSLNERSRPAVLLGPAPGTKDSFKIMHLDTRSIAHSRDLQHFDGDFPLNPHNAPAQDGMDLPSSLAPVPAPTPAEMEARGLTSPNPYAVLADSDANGVGPGRPRRTRAAAGPPFDPDAWERQRAFDSVANTMDTTQEERPEPDEPSTAYEAMASSSHGEWLAAIRSELNSHRKNGTWTSASLPKGRAPIPARWIFKLKRGPDGNIERFKARLVAKGFRQRQFLDYNATFAPTLRTATFRLLCALACQHSLHLHQMDVSTAFLIPTLKEEIYLRLPEQDLINDILPEFKADAVVRLNKCLYGLVQSPREFYLHFTNVLSKIGFTQSSLDPCLWLKHQNSKLVSAIAIFVDDCAIAASASEVTDIKQALQQNFEMTDGGPISWFLGVQLDHNLDKGTLTLNQGAAIKRLLTMYNMDSCSSVSTPIESRLLREAEAPSHEDVTFMQGKKYRALVGSLLYLNFTRPDIAFAVNQLARHVNDPRRSHWTAAVRVLRYLSGTVSMALRYQREEEPTGATITAYSDADWAGDTETRRSTTGFVFMLCGGAISWRTKLQSSVSLSTCEAELMALSETTKEAIWLRALMTEFDTQTGQLPVTINEDNQAALQLVADQRFSERTKHVAIRHFFVREQAACGTIKVKYCSTEHMLADMFTKPLGRVIFERLRAAIGLLLEVTKSN